MLEQLCMTLSESLQKCLLMSGGSLGSMKLADHGTGHMISSHSLSLHQSGLASFNCFLEEAVGAHNVDHGVVDSVEAIGGTFGHNSADVDCIQHLCCT